MMTANIQKSLIMSCHQAIVAFRWNRVVSFKKSCRLLTFRLEQLKLIDSLDSFSLQDVRKQPVGPTGTVQYLYLTVRRRNSTIRRNEDKTRRNALRIPSTKSFSSFSFPCKQEAYRTGRLVLHYPSLAYATSRLGQSITGVRLAVTGSAIFEDFLFFV